MASPLVCASGSVWAGALGRRKLRGRICSGTSSSAAGIPLTSEHEVLGDRRLASPFVFGGAVTCGSGGSRPTVSASARLSCACSYSSKSSMGMGSLPSRDAQAGILLLAEANTEVLGPGPRERRRASGPVWVSPPPGRGAQSTRPSSSSAGRPWAPSLSASPAAPPPEPAPMSEVLPPSPPALPTPGTGGFPGPAAAGEAGVAAARVAVAGAVGAGATAEAPIRSATVGSQQSGGGAAAA
mmetsp:Transcript_23243/g.72384  ORF Transcript_23243/g.72384 Transcript_23243/m.72384 type:complete len:240 (-) Transcript_23243:309-1028(-)